MLCPKRKALWVTDGFHAEVYIEFWPVQVAWSGLFDREHGSDRSILEPRKIGVRHEELFISR